MDKFLLRAKLHILQKIGFLFVNLRYALLHGIKKEKERSGFEESFANEGVVKISNQRLRGIADEMAPKIAAYIEKGEQSEDLRFRSVTVDKDINKVTRIVVDMSSPLLFRRVLTKDIYDLIYSYLGKEFYLRNNPTIQFHYDDGPFNDQDCFHCDWGLRQVSIAVNLNDLQESSTHMELLAGTNKKFWFHHPDRHSESFKNYTSEFLKSHPDCIRTTLGAKDTMFVFDAGNAVHRRVAGGYRVMLHLNFVDNLVLSGWNNKWIPDEKHLDYLFAEHNEKIARLIKENNLPESLFSMVFKEMRGGVGVPDVYQEGLKKSAAH